MRGKLLYFASIFIYLISGAFSASALPVARPDATASLAFARTGAAASMPVGWKLFCTAQPDECASAGERAPALAVLDQNSWTMLQAVNQLVNANIRGVTDNDHYAIYAKGIPNWWTYPDDGMGNCNDYALLKRRLLIVGGWPKSALLLTVVLDHAHQGHLILMVRTNRGDFMLDNMVDEIRRWDQTGYAFVKRQAANDPNDWLAFEAPDALAATALTPDR